MILNMPTNKMILNIPTNIKYLILIELFVIICYFKSFNGQFVFDDNEAILNNPDVNGNTSLYEIFNNDFWGTSITHQSSHKSYRPLTVLIFRLIHYFNKILNHQLSDNFVLNSTVYRIVNFFIYSIDCLYLIRIINLILNKLKQNDKSFTTSQNKSCKIKSKSLLITLIFATHPIHTEVVCSAVGLADLLSTFLVLFVIDFHLNFYKPTLLGSFYQCIIIIFISGLSMLFKEQGITVLGICFILEIIFSYGNKLENFNLMIFRLSLLITGSFLLFLFRLYIINFTPPKFQSVDNPGSFEKSFLIRTLNYNYVYALNIWILINPLWLCFDWSMGCVPVIKSLQDLRIIWIILFWIIFLLLIKGSLINCDTKVKGQLQMSLALIVIPFLPSSNILFRVGFVIAERALFLSSIGYSFLIIIGFDLLAKKFQNLKISYLLLSLLLLINTARTYQRTLEWTDDNVLFESGLKVCPLNAKVHYNIAKQATTNGNRHRGIQEYNKAISLNNEYFHAMNNLGNILKDQGNFDEAEKLLKRAISIYPEFAAAWMNLGIVQVSLKQYKEAEQSYLTAMKHRKIYPDCLYNLGNLYVLQKRNDEAFKVWEKAVSLKPNFLQAWNNMIVLMDNIGNYEQAQIIAIKAMKIHHNQSSIFFNYANVLGKLNKYQESENYFKRAIELSPKNSAYYANFGVLYHRWKKYDKAKLNYEIALKLNPNLTHTLENLNSLEKLINQS